MIRTTWFVGELLLAVGVLAGSASAQATGMVDRLEGRIIDTADTHVARARVELVGVRETLTDTAGIYRFWEIPQGTYVLRVQRLGYAPAMKVVAVQGGPVIRIDVELTQLTRELERITVRSPVGVRADASGFSQRQAQHVGGYFISEAEITRRAPIATDQLFRAIPFVHVSEGGVLNLGSGMVSLGAPTQPSSPFSAPKPTSGRCKSMQVFLDGAHVADGFDVNIVPPNSIRGIEVYAGPATTPPQLRSFGTVCGTVAIWTK
jgi:iron complex outermembrane recepter protein